MRANGRHATLRPSSRVFRHGRGHVTSLPSRNPSHDTTRTCHCATGPGLDDWPRHSTHLCIQSRTLLLCPARCMHATRPLLRPARRRARRGAWIHPFHFQRRARPNGQAKRARQDHERELPLPRARRVRMLVAAAAAEGREGNMGDSVSCQRSIRPRSRMWPCSGRHRQCQRARSSCGLRCDAMRAACVPFPVAFLPGCLLAPEIQTPYARAAPFNLCLSSRSACVEGEKASRDLTPLMCAPRHARTAPSPSTS